MLFARFGQNYMFESSSKFANSRVLVVCKDAGSSNLLIQIAKNLKGAEYILSGSAIEIFKNNNGNPFIEGDSNDITGYEAIFLGANGSVGKDTFAHRIICDAQKLQIPTYGIIDNWENYKKRWKTRPKFIICTDWYAYARCILVFRTRVKLHKNYYVNSLKSQLKMLQLKNIEQEKHGLFLCQIIEDGSSHDRERKKCLCALQNVALERYGISKLLVRPHPANMQPQCVEILYQEKCSGVDFELSVNTELASDLSKSKLVIGYNSYAMYVSKKMHLKTRSVLGRNWLEIRPKYRKIQLSRRGLNFINREMVNYACPKSR